MRRWPKCITSRRICEGSWTYCVTELRSCSKHAGIWEIRKILRGMHIKPWFETGQTLDLVHRIRKTTEVSVLCAVSLHASSSSAIDNDRQFQSPGAFHPYTKSFRRRQFIHVVEAWSWGETEGTKCFTLSESNELSCIIIHIVTK